MQDAVSKQLAAYCCCCCSWPLYANTLASTSSNDKGVWGCSIMMNILGEADGDEGTSQADLIMEHAREVWP